MTRRLTRSALRLLSLTMAFLLAFGGFTVAKNLDWLSPFGVESESHDSQVVNAIERTQEVSLLRLSIQGIKEANKSRKIFGKSVPGTGEKVFLQYNFYAKLGINGAKVKVTKTGQSAYRISVPEFTVIGNSEPTIKVATEDGGVLSWVTPDIDQLEMANQILSDDALKNHIDSNKGVLESQTKTFYNSLITSIDPAIVTTFEFSS